MNVLNANLSNDLSEEELQSLSFTDVIYNNVVPFNVMTMVLDENEDTEMYVIDDKYNLDENYKEVHKPNFLDDHAKLLVGVDDICDYANRHPQMFVTRVSPFAENTYAVYVSKCYNFISDDYIEYLVKD